MLALSQGITPFQATVPLMRYAPWSHCTDDKAEAERRARFTGGKMEGAHLLATTTWSSRMLKAQLWLRTRPLVAGHPWASYLHSVCLSIYLLGFGRINTCESPQIGPGTEQGLTDEGCYSNNNDSAIGLSCTLRCPPCPRPIRDPQEERRAGHRGRAAPYLPACCLQLPPARGWSAEEAEPQG